MYTPIFAMTPYQMTWQTYLTFGLYLLLMIGTGLYFCWRANNNLEDYLLGGRGLGSWVTALSAQASDMSGWLLMGLPGAVYFFGINQMWIAVGLLGGTLLNWLIVAPRLRVYTGMMDSLTLNSFLDRRFRAPKNLIRIAGAVFTLFFFTVYAAAGLVSAGKLFETMFGIDYVAAVLIGAGVMIFYTLLGGFLAVCWTDLFQGILMFLAIVVLPIYAYTTLPAGSIEQAFAARDISFSLLPPEQTTPAALLVVVSLAAWGLGYFGQPHILVRFMGIRSVRLFPRATAIAMVWVVISLAGTGRGHAVGLDDGGCIGGPGSGLKQGARTVHLPRLGHGLHIQKARQGPAAGQRGRRSGRRLGRVQRKIAGKAGAESAMDVVYTGKTERKKIHIHSRLSSVHRAFTGRSHASRGTRSSRCSVKTSPTAMRPPVWSRRS